MFVLCLRVGSLSQIIFFGQRSGDYELLEKSLAVLPKVRMGDTIGYASLICNLARANRLEEMFDIYDTMKKEMVPLNVQGRNALISTALRHDDAERYTQRLPPRFVQSL